MCAVDQWSMIFAYSRPENNCFPRKLPRGYWETLIFVNGRLKTIGRFSPKSLIINCLLLSSSRFSLALARTLKSSQQKSHFIGITYCTRRNNKCTFMLGWKRWFHQHSGSSFGASALLVSFQLWRVHIDRFAHSLYCPLDLSFCILVVQSWLAVTWNLITRSHSICAAGNSSRFGTTRLHQFMLIDLLTPVDHCELIGSCLALAQTKRK